ncbi:MAG: Ig-like domain-containing protein [Candidatus Omnitrophota bacterium]
MDDGSNWNIIASSTPNTGSYSWILPEASSSNCLIRVSDTNQTAWDDSDSTFSITPVSTITVNSPNGGESWIAGSSHPITWSYTGSIGNVKIEYSINGTNWTTITNSTSNTGSFSWTLPTVASSSYRVRVSDINGAASNTSNSTFSITPVPTITITSPNGGESWIAGSSHPITWSYTGSIGNVKIEYSINGTNWTTITSSTSNTGSFSWTLPKVASSSYRVRVSDASGTASDVSNSTFSITPVPTITITSPNGGECWIAGSNHSITWSYTGSIGNVKIEYSINGTNWTTITSATSNTGSFSWTLPALVSSTYRVRVSDVDGTASDVSNSTFSIIPVPTITVSSPNGGECWIAGSSHPLTWSYTGSIGTVKIEYSTNGTNWTLITSSTSNTGSFSWTLPTLVSSTYRVRVSDASGTASDTSNTIFSTVNATISGNIGIGNATLTYTDGGEKTVTADGSGHYSFSVSCNWSGTVTPTLAGYSFNPVSTSYSNVTSNQTTNYTATLLTYKISGRITINGSGLAGVKLSGFPESSVITDSNGDYTTMVNYNWTGTVTPELGGYTFSESTTNYNTPVTSNITTNYTATLLTYTVSGRITSGDGTGLADVAMNGFPENSVLTNSDGYYTTTVNYNWSGTVTPSKACYSFSPSNIPYTKVQEDITEQNYTASVIPIPTSEREALIALYNSTNGDNWKNKAGWKIDPLDADGFAMPGTEKAWFGVTVVECHVTELDLNSNQLSGAIPTELSNLGNLETLNLNKNELSGDIPLSLTTLTNIKSLDMDYNCLSATDLVLRDWLNTHDPDWETHQNNCGTMGLTSPNGGEAWIIGFTHAITWTNTGSTGNISIEYSLDNGETWAEIVSSTENDGSYTWTLPNTISATCRVRINRIGGLQTDTSDNVFSIIPVPTLAVTSPNGGEQWITGTVHNITWIYTSLIENVKIDYSTDGSTWATMTNSTSNTGSYNWTLPCVVSSNYWIRVSDVNGTAVDTSDRAFSIINATISGNVGVGYATLKYNDGSEKTVIADRSGNYSFAVSCNWSGTVTPELAGYTFNPVSTTYPNVTSNQTTNYTATLLTYKISGRITINGSGLSGVNLSGFPGSSVVTDSNGDYTTKVNYNWTGTVIPELAGYSFTEPSRTYPPVKSDQVTHYYAASLITLNIQSTSATGISITVSSPDQNGDSNGITNFTRTYKTGTPITLTAPSTVNGYNFVRWLINGTEQTAFNPNLSITLTANSTVTAVYDLPPQISVSRKTLNLSYMVGTSTIPVETITISNKGGGTLKWEISAVDKPFIISPLSGTGYGTITITINPDGLDIEKYSATFYVSDPGATNSPQAVNLKLHVKRNNDASPPFGAFELPLDNSVVSGSIALSGWALSDTGIKSLKILKEGKNKPDYIGDAIFIEGARPDVEEKFPDYPMNYKAGWGYLLLTNSFPDGEITLTAVATPISGKDAIIGTKRLTVANAHSVNPFGTIDKPYPGETIAGKEFVIFGWALTAQPNMIPIDGSTIDVVIDGVVKGHPVYNIFRSDIAEKFPGYANSNGAIGYFYLDTTTLANGMHILSWNVKDSAGNTAGIGSRYFSVLNTETNNTLATSSSQVPDPGTDVLNQWYPEESEAVQVEINQMECVEINLCENAFKDECNQKCFEGYLVVNDELKPLPIGSTLDNNNGIFYWQPGPGFIGDYRLVFIGKDNEGQIKRKDVTVTIKPS